MTLYYTVVLRHNAATGHPIVLYICICVLQYFNCMHSTAVVCKQLRVGPQQVGTTLDMHILYTHMYILFAVSQCKAMHYTCTVLYVYNMHVWESLGTIHASYSY